VIKHDERVRAYPPDPTTATLFPKNSEWIYMDFTSIHGIGWEWNIETVNDSTDLIAVDEPPKTKLQETH